MDKASYSSDRSGKLIRQASGYKAFYLSPLPPNPPIHMDSECMKLLSDADRSLGRLDGLASVISDPDLFVYLYVRKEALLSSQIEGTQCSLEDVLGDYKEDSDSEKHDLEEVSNYVAAMNQGLQKIRTLPLSSKLIR